MGIYCGSNKNNNGEKLKLLRSLSPTSPSGVIVYVRVVLQSAVVGD